MIEYTPPEDPAVFGFPRVIIERVQIAELPEYVVSRQDRILPEKVKFLGLFKRDNPEIPLGVIGEFRKNQKMSRMSWDERVYTIIRDPRPNVYVVGEDLTPYFRRAYNHPEIADLISFLQKHKSVSTANLKRRIKTVQFDNEDPSEGKFEIKLLDYSGVDVNSRGNFSLALACDDEDCVFSEIIASVHYRGIKDSTWRDAETRIDALRCYLKR